MEADGSYVYIDSSLDNTAWSNDTTVWKYFDVDVVKEIQMQVDIGAGNPWYMSPHLYQGCTFSQYTPLTNKTIY